MFVIPLGMMLGAKTTIAQWWLWNQIPVTLGNFVGGYLFTGLALYLTLKPNKVVAAEPAPEMGLTEIVAK
jgi:formate/nitrite transporter FocA (FNT family)